LTATTKDPIAFPITQMKEFGENGRLGNQFFQLLFLQLLNDTGVDLAFRRNQLSDLIGVRPGQLVDDACTTLQLEQLTDRGSDPNHLIRLIQQYAQTQIGNRIDIGGYFQYDTFSYRQIEKKIVDSFQSSIFRANTTTVQYLLRIANEHDLIGIHIRRGDYLKHTSSHPYFWIHDLSHTLQLIGQILHIGARKVVVYLASDDLPYAEGLFNSRQIPFISRSFFSNLNGLEGELLDLCGLAFSRVLFISNSTFSVAASMLSINGASFFRPLDRSGKMAPFLPWNSKVLVYANR
jgi:hypothetical protein